TPVPERLAEQAGLSASAPPAASAKTMTPAKPPAEVGAAPTAPSGAPGVSGPPQVTQPTGPQSGAAAPSPQPLPEGHKYGTQNAGSRIVVVAHRPARILVQGRNKLLLQDRELQPGDSYVVPNMVGVTLATPD